MGNGAQSCANKGCNKNDTTKIKDYEYGGTMYKESFFKTNWSTGPKMYLCNACKGKLKQCSSNCKKYFDNENQVKEHNNKPCQRHVQVIDRRRLSLSPTF